MVNKRAVRLDAAKENRHINKEDFKEFLREFLKVANKNKTLPPTQLEKAMIVGRPINVRAEKAKKAILPEVVGKKKK